MGQGPTNMRLVPSAQWGRAAYLHRVTCTIQGRGKCLHVHGIRQLDLGHSSLHMSVHYGILGWKHITVTRTQQAALLACWLLVLMTRTTTSRHCCLHLRGPGSALIPNHSYLLPQA